MKVHIILGQNRREWKVLIDGKKLPRVTNVMVIADAEGRSRVCIDLHPEQIEVEVDRPDEDVSIKGGK